MDEDVSLYTLYYNYYNSIRQLDVCLISESCSQLAQMWLFKTETQPKALHIYSFYSPPELANNLSMFCARQTADWEKCILNTGAARVYSRKFEPVHCARGEAHCASEWTFCIHKLAARC